MDQASFGGQLKRYRKPLDLTQADLAHRLGCSTITIRKWEADALRPSRELVERLADLLGLAPAERVAFIRAGRSALINAAGPEIQNPYKGLRAFQEADAADFFGREALVRRCLERMSEQCPLPVVRSQLPDAPNSRPRTMDHGPRITSRFLALIGASGSGKSSVVRAGLIPALRCGALPGSERWLVAEVLPGVRPLEELEAALLRVAPHPPASLLEQLQESERGLVRATKRILPADDGVELVLVLDQFEELFTLVEDQAARTHLLDSLLAAAADERSRVRVIVTLRADFYDRPLMHPGFGELIRAGAELVLPLTPDELEQAIVRPAERAGLAWEPGLIAEIVRDVGAQPGALPLLQYALTELFERRAGRELTRDAYRAGGGVAGALARRAEELYAGLDQPGQAAARQLFLRLVTPGEGAEDTRRRVLRSELATNDHRPTTNDGYSAEPLSFVPPLRSGQALPPSSVTDGVIDIYSRYRLLTLDHDPITREPTVEVAHEALIRVWVRLRQWLDQSRDDLRLRRRLASTAAEWRDSERDPSFLASGLRLEQLAAWAAESTLALSHNERTYLSASLAERDAQREQEDQRREREAARERRAKRILRALVMALFFATLGALALAGVALNQSDTARRSAAEAHNLALVSGAQAALREGNTDLALALAVAANQDDHPAAQAQFTLAEAAYAPGTRRIFTGHASSVHGVAFSPDGRTALSASKDKTLILWDVATGQAIRHFSGHSDGIWRVAFSPDGRAALSGSSDTTLILWDVATGQAIRRFIGHTGPVQGLAFSPDGRAALSAAEDMTLILWDVATGQILRQFKGHTDKVKAVTFSPDGRAALSSSADTTLILWDVATGQIIRRFGGHTATVRDATFSPDGRVALSAAEDTTLILWDVATGQALRQFRGHTGEVKTVAFSPDGRAALSAAEDATLILWDIATGERVRTLLGHGATVTGVAFSPDGRAALSSSTDRDVRLWEVVNGAEIRTFLGHTDGVWRAIFSSDGQTILSAAEDRTLVLWDRASGQLIRRFIGHTSKVYGAAFSPDGRTILSGSGDQTLILWDVGSGVELRRFAGHTAEVKAVAFSPDGQTALSASQDQTLILWDLATGQAIRRFSGHAGGVQSVAFSPDGRTALSGSVDKALILWDVASGQAIRHFSGHASAVESVAFSPDGRRALSGSTDKTLVLWEVESGQASRFSGHNGEVKAVTFSPDGRTALSASADRTLILWDLATGEAIRRYSGHSAPVWDAAFSPDGQAVLSGSLDASVRLWRVDSPGALMPWTHTNRYVPDLSCDQRRLYHLETGQCQADP